MRPRAGLILPSLTAFSLSKEFRLSFPVLANRPKLKPVVGYAIDFIRSGLYVFPKLFALIKLIYPDLPLSRTGGALLHTVTDSILSHTYTRARTGAREPVLALPGGSMKSELRLFYSLINIRYSTPSV
jgi:hypothetical protein